MPKKLHDQLHKEAIAKGYKKGSEAYNRYVYGTMAKVERKKKRRNK